MTEGTQFGYPVGRLHHGDEFFEESGEVFLRLEMRNERGV